MYKLFETNQSFGARVIRSCELHMEELSSTLFLLTYFPDLRFWNPTVKTVVNSLLSLKLRAFQEEANQSGIIDLFCSNANFLI